MERKDKNFIYVLLSIIIVFASILLYKIQKEPKYDEKLYAEVYSEYNEIVSNTKNTEEDTEKNIKLMKNDNTVIDNTNTHSSTTGKVIAILQIRKINVFCPVNSKTTMENLEISPTRLYGGNPNEIGNFCIIGHNYRNDEYFSNLNKLEIGDKIELIDRKGDSLEYKVYNKYTVNYKDLSCTSQNTNGKREVTLITCTNNKNMRLVVKCEAI